jgi:hypothetical protein
MKLASFEMESKVKQKWLLFENQVLSFIFSSQSDW